MNSFNIHKCIAIIFASVLISGETFSQPFHSMSFENSVGNELKFNSLLGKSVVLVITAIDAEMDEKGIDELQNKFPDLLVFELPVKALAKTSLLIKRGQSASRLIAKETKDSTDMNGRLLSWLTNAEMNSHFTVNELQVGYKYFIDGNGELYGVLSPEFKFSDSRIDAILNRTALDNSERK